MVQLRLTILLLLIAINSRGQERDFELGNIKFKGLGFTSTKEKIIESFGDPKILDTSYECGAFTNDQPSGPFYLLDYKGFNYIGGNKGTFSLHNVEFDQKGITKLYFGDKGLSGLTTEEDFIKIFGEKVKDNFVKHPDHDTFLLYSKDSDDGAIFTFKKGRLYKFEYWTPC
jgi:hypothetical protein